jgi:hypothetical protein
VGRVEFSPRPGWIVNNMQVDAHSYRKTNILGLEGIYDGDGTFRFLSQDNEPEIKDLLEPC